MYYVLTYTQHLISFIKSSEQLSLSGHEQLKTIKLPVLSLVMTDPAKHQSARPIASLAGNNIHYIIRTSTTPD